MDGNKDAAQKCLDIGNKALKDGDKTRAYRFLVKAQRLDPGLSLEGILSSLSKEVDEQGSTAPEAPSQNDQGSEASSSSMSASADNGDSVPQAASDFNAEQVDIVRRIRKTKDYYQILGLEKDCSAEEVRKAYRKVSLKVHPDKNKAPGADEAFKAVSKAFACLNDPEGRKRYDQFGPEEAHDTVQQRVFRRRTNGVYHEEMFDPNEIFNSFFFGTPYASNGFQRAHFVRTHRPAGQQAGTREVQFGGLLNLLQLLPILALFFLSYFPFSRPVYSLEQVSPYQFQYHTREHSVPFYVKSQDFDQTHPPGSQARRSVEAQVERDYTQILGHNCQRELTLRSWNPSLKTPHCDRLRQFQRFHVY